MKMQARNVAVSLGFFIFIAILLASCGNIEGKKSKQDTRAQEATKVEIPAPEDSDLSFKDKGGNIVTLSSLKGKVVFINFWATWCPPCIHEMPSINELKHSFKDSDNIEFLLVDVDNKIEKSTAFMEENDYDLPVFVPASIIPSSFLGGAIPTTVILDKNGEMVARLEDGRDYTHPQIIKGLNELVAK